MGFPDSFAIEHLVHGLISAPRSHPRRFFGFYENFLVRMTETAVETANIYRHWVDGTSGSENGGGEGKRQTKSKQTKTVSTMGK